MKKRKTGRVFSRKRGARNALLVSVARALVRKGKITTTEVKAKEIAPFVERLITKAKQGNLHARRELLSYFEAPLVKKMLEELAPRYRDRRGGYTRIVKIIPRKSDAAKMAIIELIP